MSQRVITYIDGFNLYYGLKSKGWRRLYWLNLAALSENLLKPDQDLVQVKYFTARISSGEKDTPAFIRKKMEEKRKRQVLFLEALSTLDNLTMFEGHYLNKVITCKKCGHSWQSPEE